MPVQAGDVGTFFVAVRCQMLLEALLGYESSLWKAVHSFVYFEQHMVVVNERSKVELIKDAVGEVLEVDTNVFRAIHWSAKVKVFDVGAHELGIVRNHRVDKYFDHGEVGSARRNGPGILDPITAAGSTHAKHFVSLFHLFTYLWIVVRGVTESVLGEGIMEYGMHCLCGSDEANEFFEVCILPVMAVGAIESGEESEGVAGGVQVEGSVGVCMG